MKALEERKKARMEVAEGVIPQYGEMKTTLCNVSHLYLSLSLVILTWGAKKFKFQRAILIFTEIQSSKIGWKGAKSS